MVPKNRWKAEVEREERIDFWGRAAVEAILFAAAAAIGGAAIWLLHFV
jgi:hypothetical protein